MSKGKLRPDYQTAAWLNTDEAAAIVGCCHRSFESWAAEVGLRKTRIGRLVRWQRAEIEKALLKGAA